MIILVVVLVSVLTLVLRDSPRSSINPSPTWLSTSTPSYQVTCLVVSILLITKSKVNIRLRVCQKWKVEYEKFSAFISPSFLSVWDLEDDGKVVLFEYRTRIKYLPESFTVTSCHTYSMRGVTRGRLHTLVVPACGRETRRSPCKWGLASSQPRHTGSSRGQPGVTFLRLAGSPLERLF